MKKIVLLLALALATVGGAAAVMTFPSQHAYADGCGTANC